MTRPAGDRRPALGRDDGIDLLIRAWIAWENAPGSDWTAARKEDALRACGISGRVAHTHMAQCRGQGMTIPDAVQSLSNFRSPPASVSRENITGSAQRELPDPRPYPWSERSDMHHRSPTRPPALAGGR